MGSKKHKKESKKKKHRSRSRSPVDGEERERKRHKKHKDRKKDRSPDIEEVPVDSHLKDNGAAGSPAPPGELDRERHRDREHRRRHHREDSHEVERAERESPAEGGGGGGAGGAGGGAQESLSIEETNKLRAKLGLKPLEVGDAPAASDGKLKDDLGEFYHRPAANLAQQRRADQLRERLTQRKEKRQLEKKLQVATLAEGSDDEDAAAWVRKSRDLEKQKQEAAKRAALLDELDEEFGVGALVAAEAEAERQHSYPPAALAGLRVAHRLDAIGEEREVVLTLADRAVLADAEDVLVNVNLLDDERYQKRVEGAKKARAGYQAYSEEEEAAAAALGPAYVRPVLAKYDDVIDDRPPDGFVIGDERALADHKHRDAMRAALSAGGVERRLESLATAAPRVAQEYLDHHEIPAFKKPKKKKARSMRRKAKEEPIDVDAYDAGAAPLLTDDTEVAAESASLAMDEEELEPDGELQAALARARRLRYLEARAARPTLPQVEEILERVKEEPAVKEEAGAEDEAMVLDATAEFCRTLGDIPTYGQAGNRDTRADILDFEQEMEPAEAEPAAGGAWSSIDIRTERPADLVAGSSVGLGAEPALGAGVAGALQLALSKGYLERAQRPPPAARPAAPAALRAHHYSIEDKSAHPGEDDKYNRRGHGGHGGHHGPLVEFREKAGFRPAVKLDYVDDDGRPLCPKEAFRYLSHKFHGKGPGKNKQEKRLKKQVQEGLMKKMSSTDTPLGTLQMLQEKQRETHSPYVVLSGTKREPPA